MKTIFKRLSLFFVFVLSLGVISSCSSPEQSNAQTMEVTNPPKEEYTYGSIIDLSKMRIIITFDDNHKESYSAYHEKVTIEGGRTDILGEQELKVSCYSLEKIFTYVVRQNVATLDFNGGSYDGLDSLDIAADNGYIDVSDVIPENEDSSLSFAGWFLDRELTKRVPYTTDGQIAVSEDVILYAGYDVNYTDYFKYEINKVLGTVKLISLNWDNYANLTLDTELIIPSTIELYPVTEIASYFGCMYDEEYGDYFDMSLFLEYRSLSFAENSKVKSIGEHAFMNFKFASITLPESLEVVGSQAFMGTALTDTLTIPSSVKRIENEAFAYLVSQSGGLENIEFGESSSLVYIGTRAFAQCDKVSSLELPEGLQEIMPYAFEGCNDVSYVYIPSTVNQIGLHAFKSMRGLKVIEVSQTNKQFLSYEGNLYSKDGKTFIRYCFGKEDKVFNMPSTVEIIEESAFNLFGDVGNLEEIVLSENLKQIGAEAFSGCDVKFVLPKSLSRISTNAFYNWPGSEFVLEEGNANFTCLDGILYSKDMKELYAVPMNYSSREFVLNTAVETINSYALCNNANIWYVTISKDSVLKRINEHGLALFSLRNLRAFYIEKEEPFYAENGAFDDPNSIALSNFAVFLTESQMEIYADAFKDYLPSSYSFADDENYMIQNHFITVEDKISKTIAYIEENTSFTNYEKYSGGIHGRLKNSYYSMQYNIHDALSAIDAIYKYDNTLSVPYFNDFEMVIYQEAYEYYNGLEINHWESTNISQLEEFIFRNEYLPESVKTALSENYSRLNSILSRLNVLQETRNDIISRIMALKCSSTAFDADEFALIKQDYINTNMEAVALEEGVLLKYALLDTSYLIYQLLQIDEFNSSNRDKVQELIYGNGYEVYGIENYLNYYLTTSSRQVDIYRFDEYYDKLLAFEQYVLEEREIIYNTINNFDFTTPYNESVYSSVIAMINLLPMYSIQYQELSPKINLIYAINDVHYYMETYSEINVDNYVEIYDLFSNISAFFFLSDQDMLSNISEYAFFEEEVLKVNAFFDASLDQIRTLIDNYDASLSDYKEKYQEIHDLCLSLGDYFFYLSDEETDYETAYIQCTISYTIRYLLETYPTITLDNYNEIDDIINTHYDKASDENIEGLQDLIELFLFLEPGSDSSLYGYEEYLAYYEAFNDFPSVA